MKKTYYLLLFALMLSSIANAQSGWITKSLNKKLSVKFPGEPQEVSKNGSDLFIAKGKDSVGYSAGVADLEVLAHLDSATLVTMKDTKEFAEQMRMGMASQKLNYEFGDMMTGKWKTYTMYTISGYENTSKGKLLIQMILIGSKMYTLSCLVPAKLITKNDQLFFSSVELLR